MQVCRSDQSSSADHQRTLHVSGSDELVGDAERVDEAGAHRLHVESGTAVCTEARLQAAGCRRVNLVGRGSADDDEFELRRIQIRAFERRSGCAFRQIAGGLVFRDNMPLLDAGAFTDPRVAGIDQRLELRVGQNALG
jgi:hypothetical protein